jgi:hypothetical protein
MQARPILLKGSSTNGGMSYMCTITSKIVIPNGIYQRYRSTKIEKIYQDCKYHNKSKNSIQALFNVEDTDEYC